ncbi:hypothetical protein EX30DRAFT_349228 [Ascodesmis nigricans]|uniref:Uncharacterized protein n=1 Tax=Ascodesmis nigricans TaxID=341454 RepID=A0A4S2MVS8_9PEZI|nr:hypothetical protein EX30DRAFT_349228 [Ascodesmis nigricans]
MRTNTLSDKTQQRLALGHDRTTNIFDKHYLSKVIKLDTQEAYRGEELRRNIMLETGRIGMMIDPQPSTKLAERDEQSILQSEEIRSIKCKLSKELRKLQRKYGSLNKGSGQSDYRGYVKQRQVLARKIAARRREMLRKEELSISRPLPLERLSTSSSRNKLRTEKVGHRAFSIQHRNEQQFAWLFTTAIRIFRKRNWLSTCMFYAALAPAKPLTRDPYAPYEKKKSLFWRTIWNAT